MQKWHIHGGCHHSVTGPCVYTKEEFDQRLSSEKCQQCAKLLGRPYGPPRAGLPTGSLSTTWGNRDR